MPGSAAPNGDAGPSRTTRAKAKARATEEELEDGEYEEALALDLRHPAVAALTIKVCNWKEDDYLDLSKGNYMAWQRRMKMELGMSVPHVEEYLENTMDAPDPLLQPCAVRNLQRNSYSIASCMKFRCSEVEQELIEDLMTANEVWAFLKKRHIKRGTMHRVLLEDEFLAMRMDTDPNGDLLGSWIEMQRLHKQIHAMGEIDPLAHLMVGALSLTRSQPVLRDYICNAISAEKDGDRFTAQQVTERIRLTMQLARSNSTTALVTTTNTNGSSKRKITTCTNCGKRGHVLESCISTGGGMAGKSIAEAQAAMGKKKRKVDPPQANLASAPAPSSTPTPNAANVCVSQGHTWVVHGSQAFLVSSPTPQLAPLAPMPAPTQNLNANMYGNFAGCASEPDEAYAVPPLTSHHAWIAIAGPLTTSLDWALQSRQVSADAMTAAIVEHTTRHQEMDLHRTPWWLDSGASTHISPERSDFFELYPIAPRSVQGVGGSSIFAVGIGKIKLYVGRGRSLILDDVLFIPTSSVRLLSISGLTRSLQCQITFKADFSVAIENNSGALIASGSLTSRNLYKLHCTKTASEHAVLYSAAADIETWHKRLGHANHDAIQKMAANGMAEGIPTSFSNKPSSCDKCIVAKQEHNSVPHERTHKKAVRRMDIVYVDLTGPEDVVSAIGNLYLMNIIDDFSHMSWTIPLKNKSEALPKLQNWHLQVSREVGYNTGVFRTDNGELKSAAMAVFCASIGAIHQFTAPYTSAHIGMVERLHRTIMSKARAMRIQSNVPPNRWDEFCLTAGYLTCRTYSRSVGMTPYEAWHGQKPNLSHLREIGCRAFVLIQDKHVPKIYARSIECILIGYSPNAKAYRCYDPKLHRVVESFHVKFIEEKDIQGLPDKSSPSACSPPHPEEPPTLEHEPPKQPRRSARRVQPTERQAISKGIPFVTNLQRTVDEIKAFEESRQKERAMIDRVNILLDNPSTLFVGDIAQHIASSHRNSILDSLLAESANDIELVNTAFAAVADAAPVFENDPTLQQAMASDEWPKWKEAIADEGGSLKEMKVYVPVLRTEVPRGKRVLSGKLVLHRKRNDRGEVVRHKARYVVKGFEQVFGKDYSDTTSPTVRMESLRTMLHVAATEDHDIQQVDIKTAFLYGLLPENEEIYMEQIPGLDDAAFPDDLYVWRLQRGLYGMKQAGRVWNKEMNQKMVSWGFTRLPADACVYVRKKGDDFVWAGVHVDDFVNIANKKTANEDLKRDMRTAWTISDLGEVGFCLGINIRRDREAKTIMLSQVALIEKLASVAGVALHVNPVSTPMDSRLKLKRPSPEDTLTVAEALALSKLPYRQVVGTMMYVAMGTRPDVAFAVSMLARFLDCYRMEHWLAALHCTKYLIATRTQELVLGGKAPVRLRGFSDSSWGDCPETSRSTMGYCFTLGSGAISWSSRRQKLVTNSSTDAEYVAINEACREAMWLRDLLEQLGVPGDGATQIYGDNNGALALTKDPVFHARSKHIKVRYHFVREQVEAGEIDCVRVDTKENTADVFTKPLDKGPFTQFRRCLGVC